MCDADAIATGHGSSGQAAGLRTVVLNSLQIVGTPEHFRHTSDKSLRLLVRFVTEDVVTGSAT